MNAIQILLKDHKELKDFFTQFEEAGDRALKTKQRLAMEIIKELKSHSQLEERFFYPAALQKSSKEIQEKILEGIEEHRIADFMIERISQTQPEDETFNAKVMALIEAVRHHLKEEEKIIFPDARKTLGEELNPLGEQMERLEKQLEG